jgi:MoaA/NifB/PqqE/SkfB family radical SAM enzyme
MKEAGKSYWRHRASRFVKQNTPRRWSNYILVQTQYRLGASRLLGLPPLMYIDPINYCNLHCRLCPTGRGTLGRSGGRMPFELFRKLVDQVADRLYFLNLYNWGEPLLHPEIFDMAEYAASKGLSVRISSNLNRMRSEQARLMVESGLEELLVDLDGATQQTYEKYRVGGDLMLVVENLRRIVEVKRELNSPFPLVTARTLITRHNESEIPQIRALAWSLGVDRFWTAPVYVDVNSPEDTREWLQESRRTATGTPPNQRLKCDQLWRNLTVSWDGGVFPCCWFHQREYDFADVSGGDDLAAVWNNERFVKSRSFLARKTEDPPDTACGWCRGHPEYFYRY